MGRRMNGSAIVRALDALGAVSGNLGIPGGGVSFYFRRRGAFDTSFLTKAYPRRLFGAPSRTGDPRGPRSGNRAVWVTAGNPVAMLPDSATVAKALETRELVVVVDSFLTDTARRAHFVLPTTTLVEDDDLLGAYGNHWLGRRFPLSRLPPASSRTSRSFSLSPGRSTPERERTAGDFFEGERDGPGVEGADALTGRAAWITAMRLESESVRNPFAEKVLFADRRFATDTGQMKLVTSRPASPPEEPGFPLWLFSNSTEKSQSSQWAGKPPEILTATCHPDVAHGIAEGTVVLLESAIGRIRAPAQVRRLAATRRRHRSEGGPLRLRNLGERPHPRPGDGCRGRRCLSKTVESES